MKYNSSKMTNPLVQKILISSSLLIFIISNVVTTQETEITTIADFSSSNTDPSLPGINGTLSTSPLSSEKTPNSTENGNSLVPKTQSFPPDCSQREKLHRQPEFSPTAKLRKCCPKGETLITNIDSPNNYCETEITEFKPNILTVELYQNCIEDLEQPVQLDIEVGNPCNESFIYSSSRGDRLIVVQDGSLLVMDENSNTSFEIQKSYCLDTNVETGELFAVVCVSSVKDHLEISQTIFYTVFVIISIPCLCIVAYLHFAIRQLRSVHGLSLGVMSSCLALGLTLHTFAQFSDYLKSGIGYTVQFFILAYIFWFLCLWCNVVLHVWYYLPSKILITRNIRYVLLNTYVLVSFSIPLLIVFWTYYKGLPGMPSYYFQGLTESIRESQRYFIRPVTIALLISFILIVASYFGFQRLERLKRNGATYTQVTVYSQTTVPVDILDQESYQEIKQDAKCILWLFVIIIITWILEIVTFYSPGTNYFIGFMEIIIALQGVFILMIFIVIRKRRNVIVHWWYDRGSHEVSHTEMKSLQPSSVEIENRANMLVP